jgi:hypothetical protein
MTRAVIRQFGFFQISVFFDPGNVLGENLKKMNARGLMNFFSQTEPHGDFICTIRQILYSFVRILNTRSAIGHSFQPAGVHSTHVYEVRPRKDERGVELIPVVRHSVGCGTASATLR